MKSLKSLLSLTALALVVSGSAFANENAVTSFKKEAVTNINSISQNQKESMVEKAVSTKEQTKDLVKSAKESTKEKFDSTKEKVKSVKASNSSSMKEKTTEKLNSIKDKAKEEKDKVVSSAKININKADAETLQKLSGIGEKKAQAIIDYRNQVGKIKNVTELSKINGLGETTIEKISPYLTF
ncbi:competence protein ComEA [Rodentibacter genomosp. 1]|uniref:Competence protein ComEA n=1 Tax=Rodentibacter genomosp. 1 TaxID=1908264 RepID=A0A1V3J0V5_9PAST|nr:helix-hairpin-helix domain-containing protein [Rodentibacter genomosp. 1]OOF48400.1 competence protein ComEA [Rodentibacter genomosp. 1]